MISWTGMLIKTFLISSDGRVVRVEDLYEFLSWFDPVFFLDIWFYYMVEDFWYVLYGSRDLWNYYSHWVTMIMGLCFNIYESGYVNSCYFSSFNGSNFYVVDSDNFIYVIFF